MHPNVIAMGYEQRIVYLSGALASLKYGIEDSDDYQEWYVVAKIRQVLYIVGLRDKHS